MRGNESRRSSVTRISAHVLAGLLLYFLTACTSVLDTGLESYREAYSETQKAGDLLYDELSAAVARAGGGAAAQSDCAADGATPDCFDPEAVRGNASTDIPAIRARRLALESVELYNLAVVDLLEGKRGDAVAARLETLRGVAGDLLALASLGAGPLPALVTGQSAALLGTLVGQLDDVAAQQAVKASLAENAGLVDELIRLLIADTSAMYDLYKTSQGKYAVELELSGGTGNPQAAQAYARIGAYHAQLAAYVRLLDQTRESFGELVGELQSGAGSAAGASAAIRQATEIRQAAEAFWAEVRKTR